MRYIVQAVGMLLILSVIWLRAVRRMTINHTTFWGIAGILLVAAGAIPPLSSWMETLDAGRRMVFYIFGAFALAGGVMASLDLSRLSVNEQELAISSSLSLHEESEILTGLDNMNEENSLCNQFDGTGGRGDGFSGISEKNK
ncbi:MAG: DUF2304 domain-containing protein [Lachnospiraceae bacterium]|nr:DUF2304 domain-containing protein [Lachnospiraceae bacterium]